MQVKFSQYFIKLLDKQDESTQDIIMDFVDHVEEFGLRKLAGRNKSSVPSSTHTKRQRAQFAYAQRHCLWHYHIGIPDYQGEYGDKTSEYVLHYQRFDDEIVLVDMSPHPPFELPSVDYLVVR